MKSHYDYIVLGCGGIGSAAVYWLACRAGAAVLGLEQFALGHPYGGSQDHSRIIRLMYHDTKYTRLTPHTYTAWATVEAESGVELVVKTGGVEIARAAGEFGQDVDRYAAALDAAGINYERWDGDELRHHYPQFEIDDDIAVLYQADGGIVNAAKGNAAHIALARRHGATILDQCPIQVVRPHADGAEVQTAAGAFTCKRLIVAAGAWTNHVLSALDVQMPLTVTQEQVTYYATPYLREFTPGRFPIFIWKDTLDIYGFPVYGEVATKAGIDAAGASVTPDTRTMTPDPARQQMLDTWLDAHIPNFTGPKLYTKTCLYTMPPDRDFVIDHVPGHPQIIVCVGAGHAYKFASLLGRILSQLAMDGASQYPIDGFRWQRPALVDPDYVATFRI